MFRGSRVFPIHRDFVVIFGMTCSGKTTLANKIRSSAEHWKVFSSGEMLKTKMAEIVQDAGGFDKMKNPDAPPELNEYLQKEIKKIEKLYMDGFSWYEKIVIEGIPRSIDRMDNLSPFMWANHVTAIYVSAPDHILMKRAEERTSKYRTDMNLSRITEENREKYKQLYYEIAGAGAEMANYCQVLNGMTWTEEPEF